jgi:putative transposase
MSRFNRLSQAIWHCKYHIVWTPKYRYKILKGPLKDEVFNCINIFAGQNKCILDELNIQHDHVHLIIGVPPKLSISNLMGILKGRTAIRVFKKFPYLKGKPYWGNHFWSPGYCVDTIGLDEEMIRKYVKYQNKKDSNPDQQELGL